MIHFIYHWVTLSFVETFFFKPWFETKNRFKTEVKPKHKLTLKFRFQTKFKTILYVKTKV